MSHNISMPKKVLLVTSGQPSLNPRLVKEADTLADAGFEVTVLYAYWNDWGTRYDKALLPSRTWRAIRVGGAPGEKRFTYLISRLIYKASNLLIRLTGAMGFAPFAVARAGFFLIREAKKHPADIYIGHNLGALPAIVKAAGKYNKPCGFDAEDFHRSEVTDDLKSIVVKLTTYIEDKYIPRVQYLTASSPLIAEAYQQLYPQVQMAPILNVFPERRVALSGSGGGERIKLFWFSQTISTNRGIEDIMRALQVLDKDNFELHLLGNQSPHASDFIKQLTDCGINIKFYDPIPPDNLAAFTSQFDIGLALEPGFSTNNNLALSNKIFTYLQAGLAIIASDTAAQKTFIADNPELGKLYPIGNVDALAAIISGFYSDRKSLAFCKQAALSAGSQKYSWEIERIKFLNLVQNTLASS